MIAGKERPDKFVSRVLTGSTYFEKSTADLDDENTINSSELPFFNLSTISVATNNFSVSNKLGAGGFGSVYKVVSFEYCLNVSDFCLNNMCAMIGIYVFLNMLNCQAHFPWQDIWNWFCRV